MVLIHSDFLGGKTSYAEISFMGFNVLLILSFDGGEWTPVCPILFTMGLNPVPFDRRLDVAQSQSHHCQPSTSNLRLSSQVTVQTDVSNSSGILYPTPYKGPTEPCHGITFSFQVLQQWCTQTNFKMKMMIMNKWNLTEWKNHFILANTVPNNYTLNINCKINNSSQTFSHIKYRKFHKQTPQASKLNNKEHSITKKYSKVYTLYWRENLWANDDTTADWHVTYQWNTVLDCVVC